MLFITAVTYIGGLSKAFTLFFDEAVAICVAARAGGAFSGAIGFGFADAVKITGKPEKTPVFNSVGSGLIYSTAMLTDFSGNGRTVFAQFRSDLVQGFFQFKPGGYLNTL